MSNNPFILVSNAKTVLKNFIIIIIIIVLLADL